MDTVIDAPVDSPAVESASSWAQAIPREVWDDVRDRYIRGETLSKLSSEHGLNQGTVYDRSSAERWAKLREEYRENGIKAATTPDSELRNRATIEKALGPQTDYLAQVALYRETAGVMQREHDRLAEMLNDDGLESAERVALTQCLVRVSERLQRCLSIPDVKPVELRTSGSERRVAAVPVG